MANRNIKDSEITCQGSESQSDNKVSPTNHESDLYKEIRKKLKENLRK